MTLLNPTVAPIARRRRAASLTGGSRAHSWHHRRLWSAAESIGGRRAAPNLWRAARRLADDGHEAAGEVMRAALRWTPR